MDKNSRNALHYKGGCVAVPLAACLLFSACSSLPKGELSLDLGIKDRGVASWYGKECMESSRRTGTFDMGAYTALIESCRSVA